VSDTPPSPAAHAATPSPGTPDGWVPGRVLGRFELLAELGRGAHSRVFRVRLPDGEYALKVLDEESGRSTGALTAFRREAALLAGIDHPGLTVIHEIGEVQGRPYVVMDLIEGRPLSVVLAADGPLRPEQVIALARDVAAPLSAIHRLGLVHRDIKPANIMIRPDGRAVLIDFGLAARPSTAPDQDAVGTLIYAPPEQTGLLRRPVDHRSDLYALGGVLFECLAGRPPFLTDEVGDLLRQHAITPAPDLGALVPGTPPGLAALVAALLAKDPDDRYGGGEQVAADLDRIERAPADPFEPRRSGDRWRATARQALCGRQQELAELTSAWRSSITRSGRLCLVRGAPGSGKTRLAAELAAVVAGQGRLVLHGSSLVDDPVPLAPLREALRARLEDVAELPPVERERAHEQLRAAADGRQALLSGLSPALDQVLGTAPGHGPAGEGPGQPEGTGSRGTGSRGAGSRGAESRGAEHGADAQDHFTVAVVSLLTALARAAGGLLLWLDDIQWLDDASARVLARLSQDLTDVPMMILLTTRSEDTDADPVTTPVAPLDTGTGLDLDLHLEPLTDEGVAELVAAQLPRMDAGTPLARMLAARTQGNPFVAQEYLRAVVDAGLLRPGWGTWSLDEAALEGLELPEDALGLVLNRVRRLDGAGQPLLVTAAALGLRFAPDVVAAVHALDPAEILTVLDGAAALGLVEPSGDGRYAFVHHRIREALLDRPAPDELAGLHRRITVALEARPEPDGGHPAEHVYALAHHHIAGGLTDLTGPAADRAFAACRRAGRLALDGFAPGDALILLRHAQALPGATDPDFLLALGSALHQTGSLALAVPILEQALAGQRNDRLARGRILTLLAQVHRSAWNVDRARQTVEQGLAELGPALPTHPVVLALSTLRMFLLAHLMQWTGLRHGTARGEVRDRYRLIAALHDIGGYTEAVAARQAGILTHTLRGVYFANRIGPGPEYAVSHGGLGFFWSLARLHRFARRSHDRAAADPDAADPVLAARLAAYRATAPYFGYGDPDPAPWAATLDGYGQWLDLPSFCDTVYLRGTVDLTRGRSQQVEPALERVRRRLLAAGSEVSFPGLAFLRATAEAVSGRPVQAVAALRAAEAMLPVEQLRVFLLAQHTARLRILLEQAETGAPFDRAVEDFDALRLPFRSLQRYERGVHLTIAAGRLAQARVAGPADRPARIAQARAAVRTLGRALRDDEQRARHRIARADLLVLEGNPGAALRSLNGSDGVLHPDAPLLAYEAARVRARATAALGGPEESARHAMVALAIADGEGWPHRASWVTAEFGVGTASRHDRPGGSAYSSSGWLASTTSGTATGRVGTLTVAGVGARGSRLVVEFERQRLLALQQVSIAASRVVDPAELARITLDETLRILSADRAFLFLTDSGQHLSPFLGRDDAGRDVAELTGYSASLVERVHRSGEPVVVTGTDEGAALGARSVVLHGLRSILVAPLLLDGRCLGVVYLDSQVAKGIFTADDAGILTALTTHIAASLETARAAQLEISVQAARRQRDLADQLREASQEMAAATGPDGVLARLLIWTDRAVGEQDTWVLTPHPELGTRLGRLDHDRTVVWHPPTDEPPLAALLSAAEPASGSAADVPTGLHELLAGCTSWATLPLRSSDVSVGLLLLRSHRPVADLAGRLDVARALAAQAATAHHRATLFAQVQALAVADELTGLANRRHFFDVARRDVDSSLRAGRPLAALMIDIDHFKRINDTYGHPTGDDVIRAVARRLEARVRRTDVVGRYGGEEFAVILLDSTPPSELPEHLRDAVAQEPIPTRSGALDVTVSIGLARLTAGDTLETLLARADQALYQAKQSGRNRVHAGHDAA